MSGPFTWSADGRAVADVAYPIRRHGGATAGIVVMTIDLAELAKVPDEAMTPGAALTVVGQHGTVIARTPSDGVALGTAVDADLLARLRGGPGEGFVESDRLDGVPSMIGYQRLPLSPAGPPLIVAVSLPRHVVVAPVVEQSGILAFGVCVVVGLVLGVGTAGSRALVAAPVSALLAVQERMAGGELAARTPDGLLRDSSEFGQLARGLAALGDRLQVRDVEQATAEGRLRAILDGYPGFAALVSRDLRVEEFNAALLDELHVTRAEVVGQPVSGFGRVSGPSTARAVLRIREALEGRGSREIIEASLPRSGVRLVDASFTPVAGPSGRIDHVAVFGIDVTDAKATERALEASRLELAEIFEGAPIALGYVTVMEDGGFRLASVNPAFTRLFPLPALPSDGVCLGRLQPEAFRESLLARCREAVDRRAVVSWDESLVRDTGIRHLHLSLSPLVDASGACTRLIGSVQDVTAEHRAAEAVREYAARMALIFNTSSDLQMLHRVDEHFTIEAVNQALLVMAKRRPGSNIDPVGMRRDEYLMALGFPPDAVARSRDKLRQAVDERTRLSYPVEVYLPDAQGGPQTFRLQVTVSPHAGDDGVCHARAVERPRRDGRVARRALAA
jgi:PAS domain S-box-containing protein